MTDSTSHLTTHSPSPGESEWQAAGADREGSHEVLATRIDPPHASASRREPVEPSPAADDVSASLPNAAETPPLSSLPPEQLEALQRQAGQLGDYLRAQRHALDKREAELNARSAKFERDERSARMMLAERDAELRERREELAAKERELELREADMLTSDLAHDTALAQREQQLDESARALEQRQRAFETEAKRLNDRAAAFMNEREAWERDRALVETQLREERQQSTRAAAESRADLERQRQSLELRERNLDEAEARLEALRAEPSEVQLQMGRELDERQAYLEDLSAQLRAKQRHLAETESLLAAHTQQLQQAREQLDSERLAFEASLEERESQFANRRAAAEKELLRRRDALAKQSQALEERRASLEGLHGEAMQMHREALEMRLVCEELWSRCTERVSPAALTQSLAHLRMKLAESHELAFEKISHEKRDLRRVVERLGQMQQEVNRRREQAEHWVRNRRQEIELQAARLVAREQELESQEQDQRQRQLAWHEERAAYQRQIRELMHRLGERELAAA